METVKRYGQFCALARALDEIGDRWTLLIVRELAVAPASWTRLHTQLPGVASNLLTQRLRRLEAQGLVERTARDYVLTPRGEALRPVLRALIQWGAPLMTTGPGDDVVDETWSVLALDALLASPAVTGPPTTAVLRSGTASVRVSVEPTGRTVSTEDPDEDRADAMVTGALPHLLAAAYTGELGPQLDVLGDRAAAERVLRRVTTP